MEHTRLFTDGRTDGQHHAIKRPFFFQNGRIKILRPEPLGVLLATPCRMYESFGFRYGQLQERRDTKF